MDLIKILICFGCIVAITYFLRLLKSKRDNISYTKNGIVYLGFLGVGVITVMDVITSVFYAPAESFRFVGYDSILFMPLTALIVAAFAFSMTEIARIMEKFGYKGGGVYSFSYMVFGRNVSLVAAASILVDYVNTAAISAISAIENLDGFSGLSDTAKLLLELGIVWGIALLNILGIRENSKVTFYLFGFVCYILGITIVLGFYDMDSMQARVVVSSITITSGKLFSGVDSFVTMLVVGIASTILAYSGIESVLQTRKLTESWRVIKGAYIFLIVFIGVVTPTLSLLAITAVPDPKISDTNLIPTFAAAVGGEYLSFLIAAAAFVALTFAVNTAMVAGTELVSTMAERFGIKKIATKNRHGNEYRIVIFLALFFSSVIVATGGSQAMVADMYAIGLVATFIINLSGLIVFRFTQGFSHIKEYKSSFFKNVILLVIFSAVFLYLVSHKQNGAIFWALASMGMLFLGLVLKDFMRKEEGRFSKFDTRFSVVSEIDKVEAKEIQIVFLRPFERPRKIKSDSIFITFALGRMPTPDKMAKNHFILPLESYLSIDTQIKELLRSLEDWYPEKKFSVHFNWPTSSWRSRLYLAIMINRILKLPAKLPHLKFAIEHNPDK